MTPEAEDLLTKARQSLDDAKRILAASVAGVAAREAYMAAFHAAQALIFERERKSPKTHSGVHSAFAKIARADSRFGADFGSFLPAAYRLKDISDYRTDRTITPKEAEAAIARSVEFVDQISRVLGQES